MDYCGVEFTAVESAEGSLWKWQLSIRDKDRMKTSGEAKQRLALNGQAPRPVRNRGEQETGNYRGKVAVEHLMDMPVARHKGRSQRKFAHEDREPDQDGETRIN